MTKVAISKNEDITKSIEESLSHLDVENVVKGKLVAVKPNDTWATPDDTNGVTQGDSLKAVIQYIKRFAPKKIIVSGGAGAAETPDVFKYSGMMDVIEEENVEFFDHNKKPFQEVELEYAPGKDVAGPQKSVMVNPRILEYETLIALNQLKVHATATVTLALKNIAMSFPAADYYGHPRGKEYHRHHFFEDMHSFIAAMAKRFPIDLAITVGHPAMVGRGPINGYPVETGITIASQDPLAADVVGAYLLGFNIQAVRHLWEAERVIPGEGDISKMNFPGMSLEKTVEQFTYMIYGVSLKF